MFWLRGFNDSCHSRSLFFAQPCRPTSRIITSVCEYYDLCACKPVCFKCMQDSPACNFNREWPEHTCFCGRGTSLFLQWIVTDRFGICCWSWLYDKIFSITKLIFVPSNLIFASVFQARRLNLCKMPNLTMSDFFAAYPLKYGSWFKCKKVWANLLGLFVLQTRLQCRGGYLLN